MDKCYACRLGRCEECWGLCTCLTCAADDKEEIPWYALPL